MKASRKDSLRLRLVPARSIEETGLDPCLCGSFLSPHALASPHVMAMVKDSRKDFGPSTSASDAAHLTAYHEEKRRPANACDSGGKKRWDVHKGRNPVEKLTSGSGFEQSSNKLHDSINTWRGMTLEEKNSRDHVDSTLDSSSKGFLVDGKTVTDAPTSDFAVDNRSKHNSSKITSLYTSVNAHESNKAVRSVGELRKSISPDTSVLHGVSVSSILSKEDVSSSSPDQRRMLARNRWKRAAHSVKFINHMAANIRTASTVEEMLHHVRDDAGGVGAATFEGAKTAARSRPRGRKGMEGLLVRQERDLLACFQDFYVAYLKMPIGSFLLAVFLAPLALGLFFTPFYLLDVEGLAFNGVLPEDATTSPLVSAKQRFLAFLNIFLYALSLSTTFGGAPVAARSPFCLLVANLNTLMAQFLFVFLSGAVFARMSQPSYPLRCSKKAIIKTDDLLPVLGVDHGEKYKSFSVRLVLTGPSPCELVDVKICLTFRIFVTLPSGYVFCSTQDLEVVRAEVPYLRYGLMVKHIINEKSPVYSHTMDTLKQGDASFSLTVMGLERTSMQPVFHLEDYFVCDDDVVWEGDYEDFIHTNAEGKRVLDHSRIDNLKKIKEVVTMSQVITRLKNSSEEKEGVEERKYVKVDPTRGDAAAAAAADDDDDKQGSSPLWRRKWLTIPRYRLLKSKSTSFTRADW